MDHKGAVEDYNQGLEFIKEGMWDEAIAIFKKVIEEDPKHVNSYVMLGRVYLHKGETYLARDCWRTALKLDPDNTTAKRYMGETDADSAWKTARKYFKHGLIAVLLLVLVVAGVFIVRYYIESREKPKVSVANQEKETKPQEALPTETMQEQPAEIQEEPEPIQEKPEPVKQEEVPQLPKLQNEREIKESYDKALADCLSGKFNTAIPEFQRILDYEKAHHLKDNAQYWLAECYYAQKQYVQALIEFQKVKQNFPNADKVFDAELKIAYSYYKLGRNEAAKHKVSQLSQEWTQDLRKKKISDLKAKVESGEIND